MQTKNNTVRKVKETKILDKKANDCALQHIKTFRDQAAKGVIADFGEPCQDCIHREECEFDWFSILSPIRKYSDIKISMVALEQNPQPDNILNEIVKDKDIHLDKDKKIS